MMEIKMAGIDHQKASIEQRELFAFTKTQAKQAMEKWKREGMVSGCLLLSTCNRTELWISCISGKEADPFSMLCNAKGCSEKEHKHLSVERQGDEAVMHLFQLICGLKSRIYGEDQIISQIRGALELSRSCGCADKVTEKLFQTAIAAGKDVKTNVKIKNASPSAARNVLLLLKEKMGSVQDLPCFIIGNGQMGKLVANALRESGAKVTMTLRKRMHVNDCQDSIIPEGCRMIDYDERIAELDKNRVVISATASPHFTVTRENLEGKSFDSAIWIDMAVPRDIDPEAGHYQGIELYDMDRLSDAYTEAHTEKVQERSLEILEKYRKELEVWFDFRKHIDTVKEIAAITADDACKRMEKQEEEKLQEVEAAVDKAVKKLLFGLRDTLPKEEWQDCLSALKESSMRDTLKTGRTKRKR
ncbi:MAG: glutamyl-tRNA reductase [Anaerovoracaceae bacterium]